MPPHLLSVALIAPTAMLIVPPLHLVDVGLPGQMRVSFMDSTNMHRAYINFIPTTNGYITYEPTHIVSQ